MRLALPLDSHSLSATSTDLCVSTQQSAVRSLCFLSFAIGFLDFDNFVVTAWRPNYIPAVPKRSPVRPLCLVHVKVAESKTSAPCLHNLNPPRLRSPTWPAAARAVYLCRGLFVPLKNVEHPLWLFRPSKNCLSTFVPAPQNTGVEGCDYGWSQITRKGFLDPQGKKAVPQVWSAQIQRQINVCPSWEEEEAIAARKLGWLDKSSGGWWWCASCHMTPNGQFWQSERSYLGTERIMQHSIYPGTNVGMPDTSLCNI